MAPSARQPAACNHALGLHAACSIPSDDGLGQVCRFLHNGADIESLDSEAQPATPLFRAAGAGNALVCEVGVARTRTSDTCHTSPRSLGPKRTGLACGCRCRKGALHQWCMIKCKYIKCLNS